MSQEGEIENEFVTASKRYTDAIALDQTINAELRKAFLAGVQYGLNRADEIHKSIWPS